MEVIINKMDYHIVFELKLWSHIQSKSTTFHFQGDLFPGSSPFLG